MDKEAVKQLGKEIRKTILFILAIPVVIFILFLLPTFINSFMEGRQAALEEQKNAQRP